MLTAFSFTDEKNLSLTRSLDPAERTSVPHHPLTPTSHTDASQQLNKDPVNMDVNSSHKPDVSEGVIIMSNI